MICRCRARSGRAWSGPPTSRRRATRRPAARKKAREDGPGSAARLFINDPDILREVIGHYYGAVTLVDKHMGRVIAALDELGLRDDTIVVFTADHGNMLGERNRMFKGVMYESSARVPLLLRGPGRPAGRVIDAVLDNSTVMPTLLELAGLPIPAGVQGKSLAPAAARRRSGPGAAFSYLATRWSAEGDWKLIVPLGRRGAGGRPELYNLVKDPDEQDNVYGKPEAAEVQQRLTAILDEWVAQEPPAVECRKLNKALGPGVVDLGRAFIPWRSSTSSGSTAVAPA